MLIAMDPNETVDIVLSGYDEKDPAAPRFTSRQLTARERIRIGRLIEDGIAAENTGEMEKADDALTEVFKIALVAWSNVSGRDGNKVPFDPAKIGDLLTWGEMIRLYKQIITKTQLSENAKKNYGLAAESGADKSAKTVEGDAKTSTP